MTWFLVLLLARILPYESIMKNVIEYVSGEYNHYLFPQISLFDVHTSGLWRRFVKATIRGRSLYVPKKYLSQIKVSLGGLESAGWFTTLKM